MSFRLVVASSGNTSYFRREWNIWSASIRLLLIGLALLLMTNCWAQPTTTNNPLVCGLASPRATNTIVPTELASEAAQQIFPECIAFVSYRGGALSYSATHGQIYVMDAAGRQSMQLTEEGDNGTPVWSPDGQR